MSYPEQAKAYVKHVGCAWRIGYGYPEHGVFDAICYAGSDVPREFPTRAAAIAYAWDAWAERAQPWPKQH